MFLQESVNSCLEEDSHLQNFRPLDDLKVDLYFILAPGPGSYRLPSDFGQYDELSKSTFIKNGEMGKTGRTSSTSNARR